MSAAPTLPAPPAAAPDPHAQQTMPSLVGLAMRLSEVAAFAAAAMYAFGVLRLTGELRGLDMSTPSLLANFEHSDVLMVGVGVLASHIASTSVMVALGVMLVFAGLRARASAVTMRQRPLVPVEGAALVTAAIALLLGARWWEGFVFVTFVLAIAGASYVARRPLTAGVLGFALLVGVLLNGVVGSYLNPPPLMTVTVEHDDATTEGLLVGNGERGEWYVATRDDGDAPYRITVIGGDGGAPARLTMHPSDDSGYRVAGSALLDRVT